MYVKHDPLPQRVSGREQSCPSYPIIRDDVTANGFLNDPLGLTIAPNGDILTVNGNNGKVVETTPGGTQLAKKFLDTSGSPPGAGTLFGLAIVPGGKGVYFVDDGTNTLNILDRAEHSHEQASKGLETLDMHVSSLVGQ